MSKDFFNENEDKQGNPSNNKFDLSKKNNKKSGSNLSIYFLFLAIFLFVIIQIFFSKKTKPEMNYSDFLYYLNSGNVSFVKIIDSSYIEAQVKEGEALKEFRVVIPYIDSSLIQILKEKSVPFKGAQSSSFWPILLANFPFIIFIFLILFFRQFISGSSGFNMVKNKAKRYMEDSQKTTFSDVAGQDEAKYELEEVVEFLKNPAKFKKLGAKIPKGILLSGRPGTGKTLLAKAVAGEAKVNFFHMSGSDFIELFVGVGASRVRELFADARKNAPSIIFIDELDAIGKTRSNGITGSHDEKEQTLNQILVEMDGFESYENVIVIGATNRVDVLDPALLRPGRFDRHINVSLPDVLEREEILKIHTRKIPLKEGFQIKEIAELTMGFSGADLANIANEAALIATRKNKDQVEIEDFNEAFDKIAMGVSRKSNLLSMTEETKLKTAYHEAGHALLYYLLEDHPQKINKVTILPRGRALGFALGVPKQESLAYSLDAKDIINQICTLYGGYLAEKIVYTTSTSGVANDLKVAKDYARKYVCEYGMSELGPFYMKQEEDETFLGKIRNEHSEKTLEEIDNEIAKILRFCINKAEELLRTNLEKLHLLAKELLKSETLLDSQIKELLQIGK